MTTAATFRTVAQTSTGTFGPYFLTAEKIVADLATYSASWGKPVVTEVAETTSFQFGPVDGGIQYRVKGVKADDLRRVYKAQHDAATAACDRQAAACTRCGGDGVYKWGTVVNGVPSFQGVCFRCHGSGVDPVQTMSRPEPSPAPAPEVVDEVELPEVVVTDGTYTLEFEDGSHKTFRIRTGQLDGREKRFVEFLRGSDNETDFQAFAFLNEGSRTTVNVWRKFEGGSLVNFAREIEVVIRGGDLEAAGIAYALKSNRCRRCNRTLTVPASIHRGFGPECAKKVA